MLHPRSERAAPEHQDDAVALEIFATFTELVGTEADVVALGRKAFQVMGAHFMEYSGAYYEVENDLWKARVWTDDLTPEQATMISAGLPLDVPSFTAALQTRQPVFIDGWDAARARIENTDVFGPVCIYPLVVAGKVRGIFTVGLRAGEVWRARDRALMRALGRGLTLAWERADFTQTLLERNAELNARTKALEAFAELSRDLALEHDPVILIGRAQDIVVSLLQGSVSTYYQLDANRWRLLSHRGEFRNPALLTALQRGLPRGATSNVDGAFDLREPYYQDRHDPDTVSAAHEEIAVIRTSAAFPVLVGNDVCGVLVVGVHEARPWTPMERALLETILRSLGLALERGEQARQLSKQRDALDARTRALSAANEELEAFSYSVSHDLRTPVRHITGYNQLLRKALGDKLDEKASHYLKVVDDAAARMNSLIDAMLDLSRTSRAPLRLGVVDLGALLDGVRIELGADVLERRVSWKVGPLPPVMGDRDLLRQVLLNLLQNALKYTGTRDEARVEVWAEQGEREWAIFVRDNGVGFDPRYQDKLFGVFQRLHRQDEFEGTGVGLANVRRIVTRHGGRVTATGVPGEGATFGFTLPRQP